MVDVTATLCMIEFHYNVASHLRIATQSGVGVGVVHAECRSASLKGANFVSFADYLVRARSGADATNLLGEVIYNRAR